MKQDKTKREQLLELFKRKEPIWKDEDHPELKDGAAEWVRKMRAEAAERLRCIEKRRYGVDS